MKFVIQRVTSASCEVNHEIIGQINRGYCVFIGISNSDTQGIADKMIQKMINLRIFEDENGKTNLSLEAVQGELLLISQFTLYANCKKGNRPSFTDAGNPELADKLYEYIVDECNHHIPGMVKTGSFGADMKISLTNDGPFTIVLDSDELF